MRTEWRAGLRRRRQRFWLALGGAMLAAGLLVALALGARRTLTPVPLAPVARVLKLDGATTRGASPSDRRALAPGEMLSAGVTLETSAASRVSLALVAGPSVRLDCDTRLRFVSPSELALDTGAIYVDSGLVPGARPIEVRTAFGVARDVGTQFEVRVAASGVRIRVREGRVQLSSGPATAQAEAGEELQAYAGQLARATVPRHGAPWDWILPLAPAFTLEGATLADVLAWSCRENGWNCRFAKSADESAARAIVLHGSLQGLDPAGALDAVLPAAGFTRRLADGILVVERAPEGS